jgi:hypothetical protein
MKTASRKILAFIGALFLSGCISYTGVTKVKPGTNPKGLRVKLPAPFVVGRPDPSGTIDYKVEYLPDPDEEYAITAWALMAKNKTDIERTMSLLLKKATVTQDTTAVAKELITQGGAVGLEALKVHQTAEAAAVAAKQKQQTDAAAALATARESRATKTIAVEKLRIELRTKAHDVKVANDELAAAIALEGAATTDAQKEAANAAKKKAEAGKVAAQSAYDLKQLEFDTAQGELAAAETAFNVADRRNLDEVKAPVVPPKAKLALPGMVIYRIVESKDGSGITLEQMRFKLFSMNGQKLIHDGGQLKHPTWDVKPPSQ